MKNQDQLLNQLIICNKYIFLYLLIKILIFITLNLIIYLFIRIKIIYKNKKVYVINFLINILLYYFYTITI